MIGFGCRYCFVDDIVGQSRGVFAIRTKTGLREFYVENVPEQSRLHATQPKKSSRKSASYFEHIL